MVDRVEVKNYYFKQSPVALISGLPLPVSYDGKVHDKKFIGCEFHPNCDDVHFVNCEFINCSGVHWLVNRS